MLLLLPPPLPSPVQRAVKLFWSTPLSARNQLEENPHNAQRQRCFASQLVLRRLNWAAIAPLRIHSLKNKTKLGEGGTGRKRKRVRLSESLLARSESCAHFSVNEVILNLHLCSRDQKPAYGAGYDHLTKGGRAYTLFEAAPSKFPYKNIMGKPLCMPVRISRWPVELYSLYSSSLTGGPYLWNLLGEKGEYILKMMFWTMNFEKSWLLWSPNLKHFGAWSISFTWNLLLRKHA